jgi:hypothetical protein
MCPLLSFEKILGGQCETTPELGVCSSVFFLIISMNSNHSLIVHKIAQVRKPQLIAIEK